MSTVLEQLIALPEQQKRSKGVMHTPAEIHQQPAIWRRFAHQIKTCNIENRIKEVLDRPDGNRSVILSGAGSSEFVGRSTENWLQTALPVPVNTVPTTDVVMMPRVVFRPGRSYIIVSFARSGNSPESTAAVKLAEQLCDRVNHVVITCNQKGALSQELTGKENALVLHMPPEANDRGLTMTSSFTTMTLAAHYLGFACADGHDFSAHVETLAAAGEQVLASYTDKLYDVAGLGFNRALLVGSGGMYGTALEGHLKLQEMTSARLVARADTVLGVRHGPASFVDGSTLIIYFVSNNPYRRQYELDLIKQQKSGKYRIAICHTDPEELESIVDLVVAVPGIANVHDDLRTPVDVIVPQLLALFSSLRVGLQPDSPSPTGAIHRVVQGVNLYQYS